MHLFVIAGWWVLFSDFFFPYVPNAIAWYCKVLKIFLRDLGLLVWFPMSYIYFYNAASIQTTALTMDAVESGNTCRVQWSISK